MASPSLPARWRRDGTSREKQNGRRSAGRCRTLWKSDPDQTADVIHCCSFAFGAAPTWREAISPPLKIIRVGIDMTPYFEAVFGLSSTFSFTILTLSPIAPAISSSAGAIMRQGPHHSAQKSTTTGPVALSTSASKLASETLPTAMKYLVRLEQGGAACENRALKSWQQTYERGVAGSSLAVPTSSDASAASSAGAEISMNSGTSVHSSAVRTGRW